jgi:hypothetical protein
MKSFIIPRRQFLRGFVSVAVCGPAVVRTSSLMRISARYCTSAQSAPAWAATRDAVALLQYEMERRFDETLFGAARLPEEDKYIAPVPSRVFAEAKTTALWEFRTWFGPRGSPPRLLQELPANVHANLFSMLEASLT